MYHSNLPIGYYLECITEGTTSNNKITPSSTIGSTVSDGSVVWTVMCNSFSRRGVITDFNDANLQGTTVFISNDVLNKPADVTMDFGTCLSIGDNDNVHGTCGQLLISNTYNALFYRQKTNDSAWNNWLQQESIAAKYFKGNSYITYASGLTLQWGAITLTNDYTQVILPIGYNNAYIIVVTGAGRNFLDEYSIYKTWGQMYNEFSIHAQTHTGTQNIQWFTIGY